MKAKRYSDCVNSLSTVKTKVKSRILYEMMIIFVVFQFSSYLSIFIAAAILRNKDVYYIDVCYENSYSRSKIRVLQI
jgi:hypothetical protein